MQYCNTDGGVNAGRIYLVVTRNLCLGVNCVTDCNSKRGDLEYNCNAILSPFFMDSVKLLVTISK